MKTPRRQSFLLTVWGRTKTPCSKGILKMGECGSDPPLLMRCFYGGPSTYLWEDEMGITQHISQGDLLMPMLFALGQTRLFKQVKRGFWSTKGCMRTWMTCMQCAVLTGVGSVRHLATGAPEPCGNPVAPRENAGLESGGVVPSGIEELTRMARRVKPEAVVWRGDPELPLSRQGMRVLGVPIGQPEFVRDYLERKSLEHETLFQRVPWLNNPQAAWLLLMCASTRANFWLRAVCPDLSAR